MAGEAQAAAAMSGASLSSFIPAGLEYLGSRQANEANAKMARENRDWMTMMSNTAVQRRMADMRAGGINPLLAAGGQAADVGSPPVAHMENTLAGAGRELGSNMREAFSALAELPRVANETRLADAEVERKRAETSSLQVGVPKTRQETDNLQKGYDEIKARIEHIQAQRDLDRATARNTRADYPRHEAVGQGFQNVKDLYDKVKKGAPYEEFVQPLMDKVFGEPGAPSRFGVTPTDPGRAGGLTDSMLDVIKGIKGAWRSLNGENPNPVGGPHSAVKVRSGRQVDNW